MTFISDRHKLIFIHIPKNAGTSISCSLKNAVEQEKKWQITIFNRLQKQLSSGQTKQPKFFTHIEAKELRIKIGFDKFDSYLKFAIVRNPWDRLYSLYNFIWQSSEMGIQGIKLIKNSRTVAEEQKIVQNLKSMGFNKWLLSAASDRPDLYSHLITRKSQLDWLTDESGNNIVDFIAKFENLNDDFKKITKKIGISANLQVKNPSNHINYRQAYNEEAKKFVAEYFKRDIEAFEYNF